MTTWDFIGKLFSILIGIALCWGITNIIQPEKSPRYWALEDANSIHEICGEFCSQTSHGIEDWTSLIWQDSLNIDTAENE